MDTATIGTGILVVGMHRNGTSATTGAIQACGVALGGPLLSQDQNNEKGYLELQEIMRIHDECFQSFSRKFLDLTALPDLWEESEGAEKARTAIRKLVQDQFTGVNLWAAKDPRLCRLLPLWRRALPDVSLRVVLPIRNPLEVASSLFIREKMSLNHSLLLWIQHVLDAEKYSRGLGRSRVLYADLIKDAPSAMTRLENELQITWPGEKVERDANLASWIEPRLKHHSLSTDMLKENLGLAPLIEKALDLYRLLERGDSLKETATFDLYRQELLDLMQNHCAYLIQHEFDWMLAELAAQKEYYAKREMAFQETIEAFSKHVFELKETRSWKITAPLRRLGDAIRHQPAPKDDRKNK
jgi:hypothetical protein